jgi:hypothetical protein
LTLSKSAYRNASVLTKEFCSAFCICATRKQRSLVSMLAGSLAATRFSLPQRCVVLVCSALRLLPRSTVVPHQPERKCLYLLAENFAFRRRRDSGYVTWFTDSLNFKRRHARFPVEPSISRHLG